MNMRKTLSCILTVSAILSMGSHASLAQQITPQKDMMGIQGAQERLYKEPTEPLNRIKLKSVFFTDEEYALLMEALEGFRSKDATQDDVNSAEAEEYKPAPRDVTLAGLVYVDALDWTLWLNKNLVKPDAIPEEVLDIKVFSEYVELQWYDSQTNQIFPLRLRPHQRFNLDAKIFLP